MSVEDAIHSDVHYYPGGLKALAPRLGLAESTLRNMAQPNQLSHGWPLGKFRKLCAYSTGKRALYALCEENGGTFVPTGRLGGATPHRLLRSLRKLAAEFGDVPRAVEEALRGDGRISLNECRRIEQQLLEMIQAATEVHARVREAHELRLQFPEDER